MPDVFLPSELGLLEVLLFIALFPFGFLIIGKLIEEAIGRRRCSDNRHAPASGPWAISAADLPLCVCKRCGAAITLESEFATRHHLAPRWIRARAGALTHD